MLLAEGLKKSVRVWWDHRNNRGCARMPLTYCWVENRIWQTPHRIPFALKYRRPCSSVCWQALGVVSWRRRLKPLVSCFLLELISVQYAFFISNNTIPQLKMHSRHLQNIQLCTKWCFLFTLSPKSWALEYSRIPPSKGYEGYEALPPWEGLHKLANHYKFFPAICPVSYRTRSCWTTNQTYPWKQLES